MEQGARYLLSVLHLWEEEEISIKGSSIKEIIVAPCCIGDLLFAPIGALPGADHPVPLRSY